MDFFKKDNLSYIIIFALLLVIGYQYYDSRDVDENSYYLSLDTSDKKVNTFLSSKDSDFEIEKSEKEEEEENNEVMVHISGAVNNPGIVKLDSSKRIVDALELAGGARDDADLDRINLAAKVHDEEKIYIPKIGEENIDTISPLISGTSKSGNSSGKININTADLSELQKIPGVGEKTAQKILDYRSNSSFSSIEDIKNVPGIGDKKFEAMKDYISTYWY